MMLSRMYARSALCRGRRGWNDAPEGRENGRAQPVAPADPFRVGRDRQPGADYITTIAALRIVKVQLTSRWKIPAAPPETP